MSVYFIDIWSILRPFGIFCGHLVYFIVIWYICPVLVCCAKINLATLTWLTWRNFSALKKSWKKMTRGADSIHFYKVCKKKTTMYNKTPPSRRWTVGTFVKRIYKLVKQRRACRCTFMNAKNYWNARSYFRERLRPTDTFSRNWINTPPFSSSEHGCQIFLGKKYQNGEKDTKLPRTTPNGHKI
jgi:hypothetical protein